MLGFFIRAKLYKSLFLSDTYHVVPEGASHQRLGFLAKMEAVSTEEGAIGAAILWNSYGQQVNVKYYSVSVCLL